jgi:hypothetical protein
VKNDDIGLNIILRFCEVIMKQFLATLRAQIYGARGGIVVISKTQILDWTL